MLSPVAALLLGLLPGVLLVLVPLLALGGPGGHTAGYPGPAAGTAPAAGPGPATVGGVSGSGGPEDGGGRNPGPGPGGSGGWNGAGGQGGGAAEEEIPCAAPAPRSAVRGGGRPGVPLRRAPLTATAGGTAAVSAAVADGCRSGRVRLAPPLPPHRLNALRCVVLRC